MVICGIDPGTHTGVAIFESGVEGRKYGLEEIYIRTFEARTYSGETDISRAIVQEMVSNRVDVVVIEDFILGYGGGGKVGQSSKKEGLSPVRIGAKIEALVDALGWDVEVVWQTPSARMVITDARQKDWGFWYPGEPHVCDAVKHVLTYARNAGLG